MEFVKSIDILPTKFYFELILIDTFYTSTLAVP